MGFFSDLFTKYDEKGFDKNGINKDTGTRYDKNGYDKWGYDKEGYDTRGFDRAGYDRFGYNNDGFDRAGYDRNGYDKNGYDRGGYDINGFNKQGWNKEGNNRETGTKFDKNGYDINGFDVNLFDKQGYHKITGNVYNENGFTREGVELLAKQITENENHEEIDNEEDDDEDEDDEDEDDEDEDGEDEDGEDTKKGMDQYENYVKSYLKDVLSIPSLTEKEELELFEKIKNGDELAKQKIIESNLKLVVNIAEPYFGGRLGAADLIQEGNIGLVKATENFDIKKDVKFYEYATQYIKHYIEEVIADTYNKTYSLLLQKLGREPTSKEIGQELGYSVEKVEELKKIIFRDSYNDNNTMDMNHPFTRDEFDKILGTLNDRDAKVVRMRYGIDGPKYTLEQISEEIGITRETVRQIEEKVIQKLKEQQGLQKMLGIDDDIEKIEDEEIIDEENNNEEEEEKSNGDYKFDSEEWYDSNDEDSDDDKFNSEGWYDGDDEDSDEEINKNSNDKIDEEDDNEIDEPSNEINKSDYVKKAVLEEPIDLLRQNFNSVDFRLPKAFFKYQESNGRIYLSNPKVYSNIPDLLSLQKKGYNDFLQYYLPTLFEEINPIRDLGGNKLNITITDVQVSEPTVDIDTCKKKEQTYGGIITAKIKLSEKIVDEKTKKESEKVLFNKRANVGTLPLMTPTATYIVNGVERVIISQIVRSYGIFYSPKEVNRCSFKVIPENGPWLEVDVEQTGTIVGRINKSRKFPITALLRVFGYESDESIREIFKDCFDEEDINYIDLTLKRDIETYDAVSAAEFIYNKLRPGELIDAQSALDYVKAQFLDPDRIKVGRIARRKINAKLGLKKPLGSDLSNVFDEDDLVAALKYLLNLCNHKKGYYIDDSDHLYNKRIRTMGEVLYSHLQPVVRSFVLNIAEKLSVLNTESSLKITDLVNFKIIDRAIMSFFATSQLSQILDQWNPLSEIEHKRRITALGPGGLKRETAKFEERDIHASHYGRICPIETPEGQDIGLITHQALYSRINEDGFLETPALKIFHQVSPKKSELVHRIAYHNICVLDEKGNETKKIIVSEDSYIDEKQAEAIEKFYGKSGTPIRVKPFFTDEIEYISPEMDEKTVIADATSPVDERGNVQTNYVAARHFTEMATFHINEVTHMDVNLSQIFSPNVAIIPFVDHNDAVRASIATSQQRQAVPLLRNEAPLVGTGLEKAVISATNAVINAEEDGEVLYVDGKRVKVKYKEGIKEYELITFLKSNNNTAIVQCPCVHPGQKIKKGDLLAEGPSAVNGEISLGTNIRVAFMPWKGYTYADAIVISQRLVKDDTLTSMHIEEHEIEVAETKLGPERTTNDIPGVSLAKLSNLDNEGIVRIGSYVNGGDILIGKITPKSEGELTDEEKLAHSIFGDESISFKDTSLYLPSGSEGKVIDVVILDAKKGDSLMAGVKKKIKVYVATTRKIEVGDKLTGRHGDKGVVSIIVPEEDMPYSADGQPIDIVLNPLGVVSRMNIGQLFETQLGLIAKSLGIKFAVPTFGDFSIDQILELADEIGFKDKLETTLYDGQTGEPYKQKVTVGYMHIIKSANMVEDKVHARSVGPYSIITQQPLGGKSRHGGQRFGEMEVWALEAYSAVYTLQEMLTVKSDDVIGRNRMYESIVKGEKPIVGGLPESFNLLTYLFRGIGQNIQPLTADEIERIQEERIEKIKSLGLSGLMSEISIFEENGGEIDLNEENEEFIGNVAEDLKDFGQTE